MQEHGGGGVGSVSFLVNKNMHFCYLWEDRKNYSEIIWWQSLNLFNNRTKTKTTMVFVGFLIAEENVNILNQDIVKKNK